jgi:hypothetical protein
MATRQLTMNQLYPIVRRVRRPFLPVDAHPAPVMQAASPQAAPPPAPVTVTDPSPAPPAPELPPEAAPAESLVNVGEALKQAAEKPASRKKTRSR